MKKCMRSMYHLLVVALIFILGGLALLQTAPLRHKTIETLILKMNEISGYQIEYSSIEGSPPFFFRFTDLKISSQGQLLLSAKKCSLSWAPWHLLTGSIVISHLDIENLWIDPSSMKRSSSPAEDGDWKANYLALRSFRIHHLTILGEENPYLEELIFTGSSYFNTIDETFFIHASAIPSSDLSFPSLMTLKVEGQQDKLDAHLHIAEKKGGTLSKRLQLEDAFEIESYLILSPAISEKWQKTYRGTFSTAMKYHDEIIDLHGSLSTLEDGSWRMDNIEVGLPGDLTLLGHGGYFPANHSIELQITLPSTPLPLSDDHHVDVGGEIKIQGSPTALQVDLLVDEISTPYLQIEQSHSTLLLRQGEDEKLRGEIKSKKIPFHAMVDTTTFSGSLILDISFDSRNASFFSGSILLQDGSYEDLDSGAVFNDIHGHLQPTLSKISLKKLIASDNQQGQVIISGEVQLDHKQKFPFHFDVHADNALLIRQDYAKVSASGTLSYEGDSTQANIQGTLSVDHALITLPEEKSAYFSHVDVTFIDEQGNPLAKTSNLPIDEWPVYLDVQLKIPRHAYVEGPHLKSEWQGDLRFSGTSDTPLVHGTMELIRGEYDFRGRPFASQQGKIVFAGDPIKKSTLYISAKQHLEEIDVEIVLRGPISEPEIVLRSTPPLSKQEILSWILFNRGISSITPYEGEELRRTEITVSGGVGDDILSKMRQSIGIDRVDINTTDRGGDSPYGANEVSLRIGKYISRGVFISINKSINAEANQLEIEASLAKYWKIEGEVGDNAEGKFIIKWERDY